MRNGGNIDASLSLLDNDANVAYPQVQPAHSLNRLSVEDINNRRKINNQRLRKRVVGLIIAAKLPLKTRVTYYRSPLTLNRHDCRENTGYLYIKQKETKSSNEYNVNIIFYTALCAIPSVLRISAVSQRIATVHPTFFAKEISVSEGVA